jgi:cytochrome c oxidase subunit 4
MERVEEHGHIIPYRTLVKVWLLLLFLTAVLVFVSTVYHDLLSVPALLTITPLKAALVFFYFMHLKYESTALKYMVATALFALVIFVGLTFTDYLFR